MLHAWSYNYVEFHSCQIRDTRSPTPNKIIMSGHYDI